MRKLVFPYVTIFVTADCSGYDPSTPRQHAQGRNGNQATVDAKPCHHRRCRESPWLRLPRLQCGVLAQGRDGT
jgi:hypothetical protein